MQNSDKSLNLILNRLNEFEYLFNQIDSRFHKLENKIEDMKDEMNKKIIDIKTIIGKQNTSRNLEINQIKVSINKLNKDLLKIKPSSYQSSKIVELRINNAIRDYYNKSLLTAKITDIKPKVIQILNNFTGQNNTDLLVFLPNTINFTQFNKSNLLTELDGLFELSIGHRKELIIVESKLIFTLQHLKDKFQKLAQLKQLTKSPIYHFKDPGYYNVFMECFGNYDKITLVYGAIHWEFDLEKLYIDDDQIIYDPDNDLYDNNDLLSYNYVDSDISYLNSKVRKMVCDPDTKFVVETIAGFKVFNEADCMSGGNNADNISINTKVDCLFGKNKNHYLPNGQKVRY